uniref:Uncharacterized protein n=1 Tax=Arundo donax TaxID=35708 RepID=A0A0A9D317_ARUDO
MHRLDAFLLRLDGRELLSLRCLHGLPLQMKCFLQPRIGLISHLLGTLQLLENFSLLLLLLLLLQLLLRLRELYLNRGKLCLQLLRRLYGLLLLRLLRGLPLLLRRRGEPGGGLGRGRLAVGRPGRLVSGTRRTRRRAMGGTRLGHSRLARLAVLGGRRRRRRALLLRRFAVALRLGPARFGLGALHC